MKAKKVLLTIFLSIILSQIVAQNGKSTPIQEKKLFDKAKEYYSQNRYGVSHHYFSLFLQKVSQESVMREEAEYYLANTAYKLRTKESIQQLESYLTKYPYTPHLDETLYMLGVLSYEKEDFSTALSYFNDIVSENLLEEQEYKYFLYLGYTLLNLDKVKEARGIFDFLKNQETSYVKTAQYYTGYCDYLLGNYDKALENLLPIERDDEFEQTASYYVMQIYFIKKNFEQVNTRIKRLLSKYPKNKNNAEIYRILGEQAYTEKNYQEAIEHFLKYKKYASEITRKDIYYLGTSYLKENQPQKAIQFLSQVTKQDDQMSENAYLLLGNAFVLINDKNNARMSYQSALRTRFNDDVREEAMYNYALTTYEADLGFGESIRSFEKFIQEFPHSQYIDKAYRYLTILYLTSNDVKEAYKSILKIKYLNDDLRLKKQYLEYKIGTESFINKNYLNAIKYFSLAEKSSPRGKYISDILYWRSESYYNLKKYSRASKDLVRFFNCRGVSYNENYTDAFYSLGYAYFSQKQYSKALNSFLDYIKLEKNSHKEQYADAENRVGDVYFYNRDLVQADKYYRKAFGSQVGDYSLYRSSYIEGLRKNYNRKIIILNDLLRKYPQSEYCDDALYEIGRSYIMLENSAKAIENYNELINRYKYSKYVVVAHLEIGLVYFNKKDFKKAIPVFKQIINDYPASEEAQTAFETLEAIAIEKDEVKEHLEYAKKIGKINDANAVQRKDSIFFLSAEKQYLKGDYKNAIGKLKNYLAENCPNGKFCVVAHFYLAESYYQLGRKEDALREYALLVEKGNSAFLEESALKSSEICFGKKRYKLSLKYFKKLEEVAQTVERKTTAQLGALRSAYLVGDEIETIAIANKIVKTQKEGSEIYNEALLYEANVLLKQNKPSEALKCLRKIEIDTRTIVGAEAKYLTAKVYETLKMPNKAEKEIMDYAKVGTSHPYWLAKSFVLLSDIYVKQGNDFQAKQYLLSLQKNYTKKDEIQELVKKRLKQIEERETKKEEK